MMKNNVIGALSLARKAGKLSIGFTDVVNAIQANRVVLVVVTSDISDGTLKKIKQHSKDIEIIVLPYVKEDIEMIMKKNFVVAGIKDINFKELLLKALKEEI